MKVLVVDDDLVSAELLRNTLQYYGYDVTCAYDGIEGYEYIRTGAYSIVISDWEMPGMQGDELCRKVRQRNGSGYIFFILLTTFGDLPHMVQGLKAGADDFLIKPFRPEELRLRLRTGERVLGLESRDVLLFTLAKLTESRDNETGMHVERMREYSRILAHELSSWDEFKDEIDGDYVQLIYLTTPMHDIGKVGIPDNILLKPGKLTSDEFDVMKTHTTIGGETLAAAVAVNPTAKYLQIARDIALYHHEKFDGSGYPFGLSGEDIPLCGRLTALADVYDALTSKRVYKPKFTHERAKEIILEGSGTHFDPRIVQAFLNREQDFIDVAHALDESEAMSALEQGLKLEPVLA